MALEENTNINNEEDYTETINNNEQSGGTKVEQKQYRSNRYSLMKWAGWVMIIVCAIHLCSYIYDLIVYLNPNFNWETLIQNEFVGIAGVEDLQFIKVSTISTAIFSMITNALFIWVGVLFLKGADIVDNVDFNRKKYIWLSVLSILFGSFAAGVLGLVAVCNNSPVYSTIEPEASTRPNPYSSSNINSNTVKQNIEISEDMQAKIAKLKTLRDNGTINEEEYKDLVARVLDSDK